MSVHLLQLLCSIPILDYLLLEQLASLFLLFRCIVQKVGASEQRIKLKRAGRAVSGGSTVSFVRLQPSFH